MKQLLTEAVVAAMAIAMAVAVPVAVAVDRKHVKVYFGFTLCYVKLYC